MKFLVKDKEFYKKITHIAVPVILQGMISAGVGMMDTFMVGKLGEVQLSATSLANQFIAIFMIMCFGLGYGAAVLTAQFYGSKNISALKKIVTIMLRIALLLSLIFMVAALLFPNQIMSIYSPDNGINVQGALYFKYAAYIFLFMAIGQTLTIILRSVGEVKLPLVVSLAAFFVNVLLNYILIFGKLGMPRMEIQGAALATLLTRVMEAAIIGGYFLFKDKRIGYRIRDFFTSCREYISIYITISIPVLISDTMLALGNNMVAIIMGHIGVSFVAANAIISQIMRMTMIFNQGVSNSSSIITGNTIGTGDKQKAYDQGITFTTLSFIIGILGSMVILIVTPMVIGMFEVTPETLLVANQLKYAMSIMFLFQSLGSTLTKGVLRGGGDTKFLMIADILFLWLASIPLGYLTGLVWGMAAFWVFIALRIDNVIKTIWCIRRLFTGKWLRQVEDPKQSDEITENVS